MQYLYEFYGNGFQGRIRLGQPITKEMLMDKDGVIDIENFMLKKVMEPVEKPKKGEPAFKESTVEQWLPGLIRIGSINFLYEIKL
jgi:hypothetical protein